MESKIIPLRDDNMSVFLETYILNQSQEFQANKKRPAVIVCPGGAYLFTSDREAEPIALRFLAQGYHAFVLRYSVRERFPQPMLDIAKAISIVRAHADVWHLNPNQITVCGFSAGGHLAASIGVLWDKPIIYESLGVRAEQIKPNALILGYPVIDFELEPTEPSQFTPDLEPMSLDELVPFFTLGDRHPAPELVDQYRANLHVSANTPPTFMWHTADDQLVAARNSLRFALALADKKIPYELHIFDHGVHGLALADEVTDVDGRFMSPQNQVWMELAVKWLKRIMK